jgi:hypothetical protein
METQVSTFLITFTTFDAFNKKTTFGHVHVTSVASTGDTVIYTLYRVIEIM